MTATADQQIDELINRHEASWRLGYDAFPNVLNRLGLARGAEIGVAFGGHSEAILKSTSVSKLYAIDSYRHRPEYDDPMNLTQTVFDRLFERTGERLSVFGDRVQQVRLDSVEAAQQIDEPLDFVYIDGDHSYEGIRADLEAWFPLVREGGIIAGHDYGQPAFPGVKAAADQFFKRFGITVTHEGKGVWWAHRPATDLSLVIPAKRPRYCDASFHQKLKSAGLTDRDHIILVHNKRNPCDPIVRVLVDHPRVQTILVDQMRGPWHAAATVSDQIDTPLVMPLDLEAPLSKGAIQLLRDRLCHSGAVAAGFAQTDRTNDFALGDLLATPTPPAQIMAMTSAIRNAEGALAAVTENASDRLIPWMAMLDALYQGGRVALEPGQVQDDAGPWSQADCRLAHQALSVYADYIEGTDLLRLKWPGVASDWLNQLDRKPVRTRYCVQPVDCPPVYSSQRLLDRLIHTVRRTFGRAA